RLPALRGSWHPSARPSSPPPRDDSAVQQVAITIGQLDVGALLDVPDLIGATAVLQCGLQVAEYSVVVHAFPKPAIAGTGESPSESCTPSNARPLGLSTRSGRTRR